MKKQRAKDPTAPERVARDRKRKIKAGLRRVSVWVPAERREELLAIAEVMRS